MQSEPTVKRSISIKFIVAAIAIIGFTGLGVSSLVSSSVEYTNVARAEQLGKTVQIVGTWVKEQGADYDQHKNLFSFHLRDQQGKIVPVVLTGAKPNNFEIAVSVVAKGRMESGVFQASSVLTKCPSKYEGQAVQ
ncbi:MAG: cytochrome c maturation protein CcmE [Candidatus Kapaibacterium sp.]